MRRTKGASRSRDRGIRCAAEEGRKRAGGGKMKDNKKKEKRKRDGSGFVRAC